MVVTVRWHITILLVSFRSWQNKHNFSMDQAIAKLSPFFKNYANSNLSCGLWQCAWWRGEGFQMYCFFELMAWSSSPLHHEMKLIRACTRKCISYNSYVCQRLHPNFLITALSLTMDRGDVFWLFIGKGIFGPTRSVKVLCIQARLFVRQLFLLFSIKKSISNP